MRGGVLLFLCCRQHKVDDAVADAFFLQGFDFFGREVKYRACSGDFLDDGVVINLCLAQDDDVRDPKLFLSLNCLCSGWDFIGSDDGGLVMVGPAVIKDAGARKAPPVVVVPVFIVTRAVVFIAIEIAAIPKAEADRVFGFRGLRKSSRDPKRQD